MRKEAIGKAFDSLPQDVRKYVRRLISQYRENGYEELVRQAVDTPARARAQVQGWIDSYDARNGPGAAVTYLGEALALAGSTESSASIDARIASIEAQAATMVDNVNNNGWTLAQVATAIEGAIQPEPEEIFDYRVLPVPSDYVTVWGDPWQ